MKNLDHGASSTDPPQQWLYKPKTSHIYNITTDEIPVSIVVLECFISHKQKIKNFHSFNHENSLKGLMGRENTYSIQIQRDAG